MPIYKPKNSEVEAFQMCPENLSLILEKIQRRTSVTVFEINFYAMGYPSTTAVSLCFDSNTEEVEISDRDFVVFTDKDFDVLNEEQFNEMFEAVKLPDPGHTFQISPLPASPAQGPFKFKPWIDENGYIPLEKVIVTD